VHSAALIRRGHHARLDHDVLFIRAAAPRPEHWLDVAGWRSHVGGALRVVDLDASHRELVREPAIGSVAAALAQELDRAAARLAPTGR
jgi:enterobactin synthetase component F